MDLPIRFCTNADGVRIAYAAVGRGPALVFPPFWISHIEVQWQDPYCRAFFEALARHHTVILYDRPGCGLSDRDRTAFTLDPDLRALDAVLGALALPRLALFGVSAGGPVSITYAVRAPERVSHRLLYGTRARLDPDTLAVRRATNALVGASWAIASRAVAEMFLPRADRATLDRMAHFQREATTVEMGMALRDLNARVVVRAPCPPMVAPPSNFPDGFQPRGGPSPRWEMMLRWMSLTHSGIGRSLCL